MRFPKGPWGAEGLTVDPSSPLVRFTVNGQQVLENTPVELPIGAVYDEPLEVKMARMIREEVSRAATAAGRESLDEAYDFEVDDDDSFEDSLTPAELHAMVHARELKDEFPKAYQPKEKQDVRERAGAGEESSRDSDEGTADRARGLRERAAEKDAGDGKGSGKQGEALRIRGGADGGDGSRAGGAGRSREA